MSIFQTKRNEHQGKDIEEIKRANFRRAYADHLSDDDGAALEWAYQVTEAVKSAIELDIQSRGDFSGTIPEHSDYDTTGIANLLAKQYAMSDVQLDLIDDTFERYDCIRPASVTDDVRLAIRNDILAMYAFIHAALRP